jgi:hypothetical protein
VRALFEGAVQPVHLRELSGVAVEHLFERCAALERQRVLRDGQARGRGAQESRKRTTG